MRYQEFLAGVATRGGFADNDDARRAADAVLATLARFLPADDRDALARAIPNLLENESGIDATAGGDTAGEPTDAALVEDVARRSGWSPERSRYALTAVVGQLTVDDDLAARLAKTLPEDLQGRTATVPPDAMSEGQQGRPQPLTADELPRELGRLVGWSGDLTGIERTVELPSERLDLVLDRIHRAERDLGHRMHIAERTPTSLTLRASTDSLQAVTHVDITLAIEVDDAVSAVGSGG